MTQATVTRCKGKKNCFSSLVVFLIKGIKAYIVITLWEGRYRPLRAKSGVFESLVK